MYSKFGTVIAIALAIFPFAAVLAKMAETESGVTVIVVAAIFVGFDDPKPLGSRQTGASVALPVGDSTTSVSPIVMPAGIAGTVPISRASGSLTPMKMPSPGFCG